LKFSPFVSTILRRSAEGGGVWGGAPATFTFRGRQQHVRDIILGQLWAQVASVHHEYGRLTLAGLLLYTCHDLQVTP